MQKDQFGDVSKIQNKHMIIIEKIVKLDSGNMIRTI